MFEPQERIIGRIEGKLDRLIEDRAELVKTQARFYAAIENIRHKQDNAGEKMEMLLTRLDKVEQPLAELSRWRERFVGAVMVTGFITAGLGGATALFWQKCIAAVKLWL